MCSYMNHFDDGDTLETRGNSHPKELDFMEVKLFVKVETN